MIRSFGLVLLTAVAACAPTTPQTAPPTSTPSSTSTSASPSPTVDAGPRMDTPRRVEGVDTCGLLEPQDFTTLGAFARPPTPWDEPPGSCVFQIGDGTSADLLVMVGFTEPFEKVKAANPGAAELLVDSHSAVTGCGPGPNGPTDMSCSQFVAVNSDRTLVITMSLADANPDQVAQIMTGRVRTVLRRLPLA